MEASCSVSSRAEIYHADSEDEMGLEMSQRLSMRERIRISFAANGPSANLEAELMRARRLWTLEELPAGA